MPDLGPPLRYAVFGGVYNNHLALTAVLDDAARCGAAACYCLGDLGGFGPHPDLVFPILQDRGVRVLQGNYDHSIGHALPDCGCGYTDPRDNHYAQLSYAYTQTRTSARHLPYLRGLPPELRERWGGQRVLMAHGSPRRVNEFLWESACPDAFLGRLLGEHGADVLLVTHSGIPWQRRLPSLRPQGEASVPSLRPQGEASRREPGRREAGISPEAGGGLVVNVGAIGRPANDGRREVWYALLTIEEGRVSAELRPVAYDHERLAAEMRAEGLPEEFAETIETGYWTTCLEILPAKERSRGRY